MEQENVTHNLDHGRFFTIGLYVVLVFLAFWLASAMRCFLLNRSELNVKNGKTPCLLPDDSEAVAATPRSRYSHDSEDAEATPRSRYSHHPHSEETLTHAGPRCLRRKRQRLLQVLNPRSRYYSHRPGQNPHSPHHFLRRLST